MTPNDIIFDLKICSMLYIIFAFLSVKKTEYIDGYLDKNCATCTGQLHPAENDRAYHWGYNYPLRFFKDGFNNF